MFSMADGAAPTATRPCSVREDGRRARRTRSLWWVATCVPDGAHSVEHRCEMAVLKSRGS